VNKLIANHKLQEEVQRCMIKRSLCRRWSRNRAETGSRSIWEIILILSSSSSSIIIWNRPINNQSKKCKTTVLHHYRKSNQCSHRVLFRNRSRNLIFISTSMRNSNDNRLMQTINYNAEENNKRQVLLLQQWASGVTILSRRAIMIYSVDWTRVCNSIR